MSVFKCKMCGGTIDFEQGSTIGVCDHCGTKQTLPRLDNDRKTNLYDRANHFRRNNDFDKAMGIYEQILNEDNTDAEAYWSIVLCRYGIEYVEDPSTHRRVPTINRTQFTSVFSDEDYKSAISYADTYQKSIYEEEAKAIDEIQKGILSIAQKEEPFDVFICYKETDANGRRTPDSVLANDLYHQLTQEGFKVFFSRITLEDKLGIAYEPYIFAALNSSKVMVVLGTKPEYFNAVWVKNEWSRYLALIKKGLKKTIIPAYRDMDPYDLPEEFSHLQAQDMSKLGFMQDLIRGIKKITSSESANPSQKENTYINVGLSTAPLLERAFLFLEDGKWIDANDYCERVLDNEPKNAEAYVGKLMADLHVNHRNQLSHVDNPFTGNDNYQKAIRFGNERLKTELNSYITTIEERNELARKTSIYNGAKKAMGSARAVLTFRNIAREFKSISGFKDADKLADDCLQKAEKIRKDASYDLAVSLMKGEENEPYERALSLFKLNSGWRDSDEKAIECQKQIDAILERKETQRISAEKAAKIKKKIIGIAAIAFVVVISSVLIWNNVIVPNQKYRSAMKLKNQGKYEEAISAFDELRGYKDSKDQIEACWAAIKDPDYDAAMALKNEGKYEEAISAFQALNGYRDSRDQITACQTAIVDADYDAAMALKKEGKYQEAISAFKKLDDYRDSAEQVTACRTAIKDQKYEDAIALKDEGKYEEAITAFKQLTDYKDSADQVTACQTAKTDQDYNNAITLKNEGKYEEAIAVFETIKEYKDSTDQITACQDAINEQNYIAAISLIDEGDYVKAFDALKDLNGYKDSAEKAKEITLQVEKEKLKKATPGDIIIFGTYEQDNKTENGKENIEWQVLKKEEGKVLVISSYVLDCQKYHSSRTNTTWANCSLRSWLNNTFMNEAFTAQEKAMIKSTKVSADANPDYKTSPGSSTTDKVFLLSIDEAKAYFPYDNVRKCSPTLYAEKKGAWTKASYKTIDGKPTCWWWLRTPGKDQKNAANIFRDGLIDYEGDDVDFTEDGVRPAMWISVEG